METTTAKRRELEVRYGIGDVSKMCSVPTHTIRFWEQEFGDFLSPARTSGMQRRYSDADIDQIMKIKKLLWTDRFSIQGAKRMLAMPNAPSFPLAQETVSIPNTHELAMSIARFIQDQLTSTRLA